MIAVTILFAALCAAWAMQDALGPWFSARVTAVLRFAWTRGWRPRAGKDPVLTALYRFGWRPQVSHLTQGERAEDPRTAMRLAGAETLKRRAAKRATHGAARRALRGKR